MASPGHRFDVDYSFVGLYLQNFPSLLPRTKEQEVFCQNLAVGNALLFQGVVAIVLGLAAVVDRGAPTCGAEGSLGCGGRLPLRVRHGLGGLAFGRIAVPYEQPEQTRNARGLSSLAES